MDDQQFLQFVDIGVTGISGSLLGMTSSQQPIGPVDATKVPRYAGPPTFARLPRTDQVTHTDIAVVGIPFDSGASTSSPSRCTRLPMPATSP